MKNFKEFKIPFIGLKEGMHHFNYQIDKKFFDVFEYDEFESVDFDVLLEFNKKINILELNFKAKGKVYVPCDVTGEYFDLDVEGELPLIVKFGDAFDDENDEMLILPHGAYEIEIQQYLYELIILSVPQKRVKPGVESGLDDFSETTALSEEDKSIEDSKSDIDPRWDQLKKLLGK